jgi:DNA methylase
MTKYGPHNPHPLSTMRTELVWEGKYDEFGGRREVNVAAFSMPLQKIETIDEPRSRAEAHGELFDERKAHRDDFRNRLIWGDNKLITASLLEEFKGAIDLIYIDPPFDVGTDFSLSVPLGDGNDTVAKEQSILEMVAYRDMWGKGTNSYLHMLYERLLICRELLSEQGVIYVHIGPNINHLVRALLDEVFGRNRMPDCLFAEVMEFICPGPSWSMYVIARHSPICLPKGDNQGTLQFSPHPDLFPTAACEKLGAYTCHAVISKNLFRVLRLPFLLCRCMQFWSDRRGT